MAIFIALLFTLAATAQALYPPSNDFLPPQEVLENACQNQLADHFNNSRYTQRCQLPFTYKGIVYSECTDADASRPWCYHAKQTLVQSASSDHPAALNRWGSCLCAPALNNIVGGVGRQCAEGMQLRADSHGQAPFNRRCVFPFTYKGVRFDSCTDAEWTSPWCALKTCNEGRVVKGQWGQCGCV